MRQWLRRWQIERQKRKARRAYADLERIGDEMDCGHSLAMFLSSRYRGAQQRYDAAVARVQELDPECPR
jgi:hypothetical protein